jgi:hypothetical protein
VVGANPGPAAHAAHGIDIVEMEKLAATTALKARSCGSASLVELLLALHHLWRDWGMHVAADGVCRRRAPRR